MFSRRESMRRRHSERDAQLAAGWSRPRRAYTSSVLKLASASLVLCCACAEERRLGAPPPSAPSGLRSWAEAERLAGESLRTLSHEEKARLVRGVGWSGNWRLKPGFYTGNIEGIPEKGIPWLRMEDSADGYRENRFEGIGTAIVWPSPLAAASTWDEALVEAQAAAIGREFRGKHANVILGPAVNVHRVARGGRNWELLSGEDPYLGARLARSYIQGVQSEGVMAVVKHFAFNEQETHRQWVNSEVDDRTAWELYYPPFEAAVDAGAAAFMCSYNKVNGTYACSNSELLKRDLKEKIGFRGFVMSDWGATHSTGLTQGNDMEQPGISGFFSFGAIQHLDGPLDDAARRILAATFHLGLDRSLGCSPPACIAHQNANTVTPASVLLARNVATSAVTLLKNEGSPAILPLDPARIKRIAVLGRAADAKPVTWWKTDPADPGLPVGDYYSGGGSGHLQAQPDAQTTLDAIRARAANGTNITVLTAQTTFDHSSVASLGEVDAYIVVAGATAEEGVDRKSLSLADDADKLISSLPKGKPIVVLLMLPGAILMPWRGEVAAIASLFFAGQETGAAWASILFGDASPAGKLPIMMPASEADVIEPSMGRSVRYEERAFTSYRNPNFKAAFPFGHGLSYTTFKFRLFEAMPLPSWSRALTSQPSIKTPSSTGPAMAHASLVVVNTGSRPGQEVAQVYAHFPKAPPGTPRLRLVGFRKTKLLKPMEQEVVRFDFYPRDFAMYAVLDGWRIEDSVILSLGTSSADLVPQEELNPHSGTIVLPPKPSSATKQKLLVKDLMMKVEDVPGIKPMTPLVPPSEANTWILWLLQPLLLALVIGCAILATREGNGDGEAHREELLLEEAEEMEEWEGASQTRGLFPAFPAPL